MNTTNNDSKVKGKGCLGFTIFGLPILIGLFILIILVGFYAYSIYNKCIEKNEAVKNAWSNVETSYQKRMDLIPNIVATVKGYAEHEQETLVKITEARSKASSINLTAEDLTEENLAKFAAAQEELSTALNRLLATVENYPELKANQNFMDLQNELKNIESEINLRRDTFNSTVKDYNIFVLKFPKNIFAKLFGFHEKYYFKAKEGAENAPEVKF